MKISKTVLKAMAVAAVVSTTVAACTKEKLELPGVQLIKAKKKAPAFDCPACGMG